MGARLPVAIGALMLAAGAGAAEFPVRGFSTDTSKRAIDLDELVGGGPGKDGIPAIVDPVILDVDAAAERIPDREPVIVVRVEDAVRAYPIRILMWHEIANDELGGVPIAVTFCPLCYSAVVFDRRVGDRTLTLKVSGMLRDSDMVMYDVQTETLWQQITGKALVGELVGTTLEQFPSQIASFEQFRDGRDGATVLGRPEGVRRGYGANPYRGYDRKHTPPIRRFFRGKAESGGLPPKERVVAVPTGDGAKVYPRSTIVDAGRVIHDHIGDRPIVVWCARGAVSALDERRIAESREVGTFGVFEARLDGTDLEFTWDEDRNRFVDQHGGVWDPTGRCVEGEHAGAHLPRVRYAEHFAFAWFRFFPESELHRAE